MGRMIALSPLIVKSPVDQPPSCTTAPRPNDGSQPSCTEKMYRSRIAIRNVGKDTPTSDRAMKSEDSADPRLRAV